MIILLGDDGTAFVCETVSVRHYDGMYEGEAEGECRPINEVISNKWTVQGLHLLRSADTLHHPRPGKGKAHGFVFGHFHQNKIKGEFRKTYIL